MTQSKREPFAKATKHPTLDTWLVADAAGNNLCWADDSQAWEQWDAESRANSINAAFNARVDEEVKKAVEEFKWKAVKALKSLSNEEENLVENTGGQFGSYLTVNALSRAADVVFVLSTEPEGK